MGEYSSWFVEDRRKNSPIKYYLEWVDRRWELWLQKIPFSNSVIGQSQSGKWLKRAKFLNPIFERTKKNKPKPIGRNPQVLHLIGSLWPGGAERQLCNCVIGQRKLGYDVSVLLIYRNTSNHDHYGRLLDSAGVRVKVAGEYFNTQFESAIKGLSDGRDSLDTIPREFRRFVIDILGDLIHDPPDILHCWLDHTNIWGAVAGLLADVPRIILSTRNVNPTNLPFDAPYFYAMYQQLVQFERIGFIANSNAGAEDYANWLNIPKDKFSVILNGVDTREIVRATSREVADFRVELGIESGVDIVAGVFRLSEEKQPLMFLEVIKRILQKSKKIIAVIAGIGPLESEVKDYIVAHNLQNHVILLGRRNDVKTIFSAATIKLLCSRYEGTPNVLLEAQLLGCPVVATKAGGTVDVIEDGITGYLVDVGDIEGLTASTIRLLDNVDLRVDMSRAAPNYIRQKFDIDNMVKETIDVY